MVDHEGFAGNFAGHAMPSELDELLAFDDSADGSYYSDGFELIADDKSGLSSWSEDEQFQSALIPFAQATGSGSFYALWAGAGAEPSAMPVVVFGDEGGVHVVAENVRALLRLLTFDCEPMVDTKKVLFHKGKTHDPTDAHHDYVAWLGRTFGLPPVESASEIVEPAQAKHKAAFDAWMARFVSR